MCTTVLCVLACVLYYAGPADCMFKLRRYKGTGFHKPLGVQIKGGVFGQSARVFGKWRRKIGMRFGVTTKPIRDQLLLMNEGELRRTRLNAPDVVTNVTMIFDKIADMQWKESSDVDNLPINAYTTSEGEAAVRYTPPFNDTGDIGVKTIFGGEVIGDSWNTTRFFILVHSSCTVTSLDELAGSMPYNETGFGTDDYDRQSFVKGGSSDIQIFCTDPDKLNTLSLDVPLSICEMDPAGNAFATFVLYQTWYQQIVENYGEQFKVFSASYSGESYLLGCKGAQRIVDPAICERAQSIINSDTPGAGEEPDPLPPDAQYGFQNRSPDALTDQVTCSPFLNPEEEGVETYDIPNYPAFTDEVEIHSYEPVLIQLNIQNQEMQAQPLITSKINPVTGEADFTVFTQACNASNYIMWRKETNPVQFPNFGFINDNYLMMIENIDVWMRIIKPEARVCLTPADLTCTPISSAGGWITVPGEIDANADTQAMHYAARDFITLSPKSVQYGYLTPEQGIYLGDPIIEDESDSQYKPALDKLKDWRDSVTDFVQSYRMTAGERDIRASTRLGGYPADTKNNPIQQYLVRNNVLIDQDINVAVCASIKTSFTLNIYCISTDEPCKTNDGVFKDNVAVTCLATSNPCMQSSVTDAGTSCTKCLSAVIADANLERAQEREATLYDDMVYTTAAAPPMEIYCGLGNSQGPPYPLVLTRAGSNWNATSIMIPVCENGNIPTCPVAGKQLDSNPAPYCGTEYDDDTASKSFCVAVPLQLPGHDPTDPFTRDERTGLPPISSQNMTYRCESYDPFGTLLIADWMKIHKRIPTILRTGDLFNENWQEDSRQELSDDALRTNWWKGTEYQGSTAVTFATLPIDIACCTIGFQPSILPENDGSTSVMCIRADVSIEPVNADLNCKTIGRDVNTGNIILLDSVPNNPEPLVDVINSYTGNIRHQNSKTLMGLQSDINALGYAVECGMRLPDTKDLMDSTTVIQFEDEDSTYPAITIRDINHPMRMNTNQGFSLNRCAFPVGGPPNPASIQKAKDMIAETGIIIDEPYLFAAFDVNVNGYILRRYVPGRTTRPVSPLKTDMVKDHVLRKVHGPTLDQIRRYYDSLWAWTNNNRMDIRRHTILYDNTHKWEYHELCAICRSSLCGRNHPLRCEQLYFNYFMERFGTTIGVERMKYQCEKMDFSYTPPPGVLSYPEIEDRARTQLYSFDRNVVQNHREVQRFPSIEHDFTIL